MTSPARIPCPCCGHEIPETDWRPEPPRWAELLQFVEGAKQRGWSAEQIAYLKAMIGLVWAKAYKRGQFAAGHREGL
jgi:hypothetical protein